MKTNVIAIVAIAFLSAGSLVGCSHSDKDTARNPKKPVSAVCPVMKNKIPDITKAAGKSVYKGKTYYFCCSGCKPLFDKDPKKYVGK